jgi:uncharacterized sporulation protein YeaH/YhbH (DUF444 family)
MGESANADTVKNKYMSQRRFIIIQMFVLYRYVSTDPTFWILQTQHWGVYTWLE